jgi:aarF domain-containing kinase
MVQDPHPGNSVSFYLIPRYLITHTGNLLIRPSPKGSRSPYNFEIVLLDHGLYFDMDTELRTNYSRMWLSLISRDSPSVRAARRKYAALVGNIGPDLVRTSYLR